MKKFLKFVVIFLGLMIITLFLITVITIYKKYSFEDNVISEDIVLNPLVNQNYEILSFYIEKFKLYINVKDLKTHEFYILMYNLKTGNLTGKVRLKNGK